MYFSSFSANENPIIMRNVNVPKTDNLEQIKKVKLEECSKACEKYEGCNSYQYNAEANLCDLTNVTQLTEELKPNKGKWDIYLIDPG